MRVFEGLRGNLVGNACVSRSPSVDLPPTWPENRLRGGCHEGYPWRGTRASADRAGGRLRPLPAGAAGKPGLAQDAAGLRLPPGTLLRLAPPGAAGDPALPGPPGRRPESLQGRLGD